MWTRRSWLAVALAGAAGLAKRGCTPPILAVAGGTPAIHVRQPTDTRKGQMWRDVGFGDWLFAVDAATGPQIADRLLAIDHEPAQVEAMVAKARAFTRERGRAMVESVGRGLAKA